MKGFAAARAPVPRPERQRTFSRRRVGQPIGWRAGFVMRVLRRAAMTAMVAALFVAPVSGAIAATADDRPATGLRVTFGQLLGEHAYLLMETMRAAALGTGEEAAVRAGLDDCTDNIREAIAGIYGEAGGDAFG